MGEYSRNAQSLRSRDSRIALSRIEWCSASCAIRRVARYPWWFHKWTWTTMEQGQMLVSTEHLRALSCRSSLWSKEVTLTAWSCWSRSRNTGSQGPWGNGDRKSWIAVWEKSAIVIPWYQRAPHPSHFHPGHPWLLCLFQLMTFK